MRHKRAGFKLKRNVSARKALLRGLVTSVIVEERIITTVPKAKAARPLVEKMITLAKRKGDGAEQAMLELVGSELVKRAAERAKRREERLQAIKEGREHEEGEEPQES